MVLVFKILGAMGLILITIGVLLRNEKVQDILFIAGGVALEAYSIHIKDALFITLQVVFILSATYDLIKLQLQRK